MKKIILIMSLLAASSSFASHGDQCTGSRIELAKHLDAAFLNYEQATKDYNETIKTCSVFFSETFQEGIERAEKECEESYKDFSYREAVNEILKCKINYLAK